MDDLKERNKAWPAAMGHGDALSVDFVCALLAENTARIAALEAKVKEAAAAERARIVAWLRDQDDMSPLAQLLASRCDTPDVDLSWTLPLTADAIEAGEV